MSEKRIITTLSIVGQGAERALLRSGSDPANFVIPVHEGESTVATSFGKIGVDHIMQRQNGSDVRIVQLDCSDAPGLLWRSRKNNPHQKIAVNREGTGGIQVRTYEIFVATNHFKTE